MIQLRIREVALPKGWNLSRFQRAADLPVSTARRYWWSSKSGLSRDRGTLAAVGLPELTRIADLLEVEPSELITRGEEV
jgi:hypothetical protein